MPTTISASMLRRATIASVLGNALEWFDFVSYGSFSVLIARKLFPPADLTVSILLGFATLGISFVVRPIGGLVFGIYADRYGRKKALSFIFGLMAIGTLMIAVVPTYSAIGISASLMLILARVIQGFSSGGEFASATATLIEFAPRERRGLYGSLQMVSQILATVLASLCIVVLTKLLSENALTAWGWRLPFLFGALIGPIGLYMRHNLAESPEFQAEIARLGRHPSAPLRRVLERHRLELIASFCLVAAITGPSYISSVYLPELAINKLGMTSIDATLPVLLAACLMIVLVPLSAWWSDRFSRIGVIGFGLVAFLVTYPILFARFVGAPTFSSMLQLQLGAGFFYAFAVGPAAAQITEIFPVGVRSTGVSSTYNLAVMLFGGMAPFTLTLFSGQPYGPAFYTAGLSLLGLIGLRCLSVLKRRSAEAHNSLEHDVIAKSESGY